MTGKQLLFVAAAALSLGGAAHAQLLGGAASVGGGVTGSVGLPSTAPAGDMLGRTTDRAGDIAGTTASRAGHARDAAVGKASKAADRAAGVADKGQAKADDVLNQAAGSHAVHADADMGAQAPGVRTAGSAGADASTGAISTPAAPIAVGSMVRDAKGATLGKVERVFADADGRQRVVLRMGRELASVPASTLTQAGKGFTSTQTKAELRAEARGAAKVDR